MRDSCWSSGVRRDFSLLILAIFALIFPLTQANASFDQSPPAPQQGEAAYLSNANNTVTQLLPFEPQFSGCGGGTVNPVNSVFEQRVVELVNAERAAVGKPPLKRVSQLDQAARYHAADMRSDNYFNHDTYDLVSGQLQKVCDWFSRLGSYYTGWTDLGENIAVGYPTPESVVTAWMNSPGHKANILRDTFYEIGVGYYNGYWVQDFGRRSNIYPVLINNEASTSNSRDVTLYIYGTWTEMRLHNNTETWTDWQPFQNSVDWRLPNLAGDQTVSAEVRKIGSLASGSDTIYLDLPQQPVLGDLPDVISFTFSTQSKISIPDQVQFSVFNEGTQTPLYWQVTASDPWIKLDPKSGVTPGILTISIDNSVTKPIGTYRGSISLSVTSPPGVLSTPQTILVQLNVLDTPIWKCYLPLSSK